MGAIVVNYRRTFMVYTHGHLPSVAGTRPDESSSLFMGGEQ